MPERSEGMSGASGPLVGLKVVELSGLGPAPYCGMLLSDLGADVIRIDRPLSAKQQAAAGDRPLGDIVTRGRRSIVIDMKAPGGVNLLLQLIDSADALLDPYRPGVTERLGVGPDVCLARNPRLVYSRMTGWGQDGPLAPNAGHDINYVALGGALAHIGRQGEAPVPPLNLVGDMGGGGLFLAFGTVSALLEAQRSGTGQVVDMAMIDGVASLMTMIYGYHAQGHWSQERGTNVFDTGSFFYDVFECADGNYVSIGPIEFPFYDKLLTAIGLSIDDMPKRSDRSTWAESKARISAAFRARTRDEWSELLEPLPDLCFAPVLTMLEAPDHPHHQARGTFLVDDGVVQPAPAPRYSRTPGQVQRPPAATGEHTDEVLSSWLGLDERVVRELRDGGTLG
jgi:alpha-methylacyl-CoA racemase